MMECEFCGQETADYFEVDRTNKYGDDETIILCGECKGEMEQYELERLASAYENKYDVTLDI